MAFSRNHFVKQGAASIYTPGQDGVDAVTSEDKTIRARTYIAPFSYIEVRVPDPKSLAILDKQQGFDSQKLADPSYKPLDISQSVGQKYVAGRISSLIELSVGGAVMHSELNRRGKMEVGEPKVRARRVSDFSLRIARLSGRAPRLRSSRVCYLPNRLPFVGV